MSLSPEMKYWFSSHYILNTIACTIYMLTKTIHPVCISLFELDENGNCQLDYRDTEVLFFLAMVIVLKNRKWKPLTAVEYVSNIYLFAKLANLLLFFRQDLRWGALYAIVCLLLFIAFPEPSYTGPEKITYFRGQALDEQILHHPEETWIIEFFAPWSPPCNRFASTFANLSLKYDHPLLKFGKLDVNKYEKIGQKHRVDVSVSSKNLPTIIVFENGKEISRQPTVNPDGSIKVHQFKEENLIRDLDLNDLYARAKQRATDRNKKKN